VKDKSPAGPSGKDKLIWKWLKGPQVLQADFGDPLSTAAYTLCVYTGAGLTNAIELFVPAGGTCSGADCWKAIGGKGYKYKDPSGATDGVANILLKGGAAGKSKLLVKGKGSALPALGLPFDDMNDVKVQLHNSDNGNCWEAIFPPGSVKKSSDAQYKAKTS